MTKPVESIESDMGFSLSTHRCFVDTGNPSSTTRLYVDHDGQANVNCTRKDHNDLGEYATR